MLGHPTAIADWLIVLPVLLGLLGGALLLLLRGLPRLQMPLALLVALAILVADITLFQRVMAGGPLSMTMGRWLPPFGISFTADLMGAGFALTAAFVTAVVIVYLESDVPHRARRDGVYPLILLLLAGVSGAFLTGDAFNLYVWFEVMLIASFGLLSLAGNPLQLDGTVKYGVLNFLATTLFLAGLGLLHGLVGTLNMADIIVRARGVDAAPLTGVAALLLLAFGIKAAAFPVNAWLPASYHTPPAALSALLAGLLTKVGVYALIRVLLFMLPASLAMLQPVLFWVALLTMLLGPLGAIAETNIRRAIGFMLIGGIGVILIGLALPSPETVAGSVLYIFHAMLTLTGLYLVGGLVEPRIAAAEGAETGVFSSPKHIGPPLFVLFLSISGIPPFLGFWPKLLLLQGLVGNAGFGNVSGPDLESLTLTISLLLNAFLTLIAAARLWSRLFWKSAIDSPLSTVRAPRYALVASGILTLVVIVFGLFPALPLDAATEAAAGLLDPSAYIAAVGLSP